MKGTRKHLAAEKKRLNTHNCAQAVVCTYCDLVGLPEETALDIAGAYGTGMGCMEGTCILRLSFFSNYFMVI